MVVVWFLAICSIVVHGLSIPLGKFGFFLPRTLSRAFTSQSRDDIDSFPSGDRSRASSTGAILRERRKRRPNGHSGLTSPADSTAPPVFRIGGSIISEGQSSNAGTTTGGNFVDAALGERPSTVCVFDG